MLRRFSVRFTHSRIWLWYKVTITDINVLQGKIEKNEKNIQMQLKLANSAIKDLHDFKPNFTL